MQQTCLHFSSVLGPALGTRSRVVRKSEMFCCKPSRKGTSNLEVTGVLARGLHWAAAAWEETNPVRCGSGGIRWEFQGCGLCYNICSQVGRVPWVDEGLVLFRRHTVRPSG